MEVQYPDHSKPLYVAAQINDVHIRRALVDTSASLNLIPVSTLKAARIPLSRITGAPIEVFSFAGIHECTLGSIQLVLKVGPVVALTRFHVIDSTISYHAREAMAPQTQACAFHLSPMCQRKIQCCLKQKGPGLNEASTTPTYCYTQETEAPAVEENLPGSLAELSEEPPTRPTSVNAMLPPLEKAQLISLLKEYIDVFAWEYHEMPGLDPNLVAHAFNVEPGGKPVVQPMQTFHPKVEA
ncbi:uncharacterized protein LOC142616435 [Castanea sativa]|uniref:uncharacterized protein LOC142616435 n=1 Tax=Castanea sativa TaxID=21020 RepID=UPI003F64C1C9